MKTLFQQVLVRLSKKDLHHLAQEVKETISFEHNNPKTQKLFTSQELWRIQSLKKPVAIRKGFNRYSL